MPRRQGNVNSSPNHLIALLPARARTRLIGQSEAVPLVLAQVLCERASPMPYAYFPLSGSIALLTSTADSPDCETGLIGDEGMLGAHLSLGDFNAPQRAVVQMPGSALRIRSTVFRAELRHLPALQRLIDQYLFWMLERQSVATACVHFHLITARLARWLLMSQDCARADQFKVTHEALAHLLGVRRVSITNSAGALQRGGSIRYRRGVFEVVQRDLLVTAACECYAADRRSYAQLVR